MVPQNLSSTGRNLEVRAPTGHRLLSCDLKRGRSMASLYYLAAGTDSGSLISCEHEHETIASAVACLSKAGGYVVAVENGEVRVLDNCEEAEFQYAMYGLGAFRDRLKAFIPFRISKWLLN